MIASVELLRIRLRTTNSKVVRRTDLASWDFRLIPISLTKTCPDRIGDELRHHFTSETIDVAHWPGFVRFYQHQQDWETVIEVEFNVNLK